MTHSILKRYVALLGLVTLLSACAGSPENSASSNANSAQQANSNSQQATPADASPNVAPPAVQVIPPPATLRVQPPVTANAATPSTAANGRAPKLIAPAKRLEFGKQPQDKTLIRAIVIKNGGRANLNVESVTPS